MVHHAASEFMNVSYEKITSLLRTYVHSFITIIIHIYYSSRFASENSRHIVIIISIVIIIIIIFNIGISRTHPISFRKTKNSLQVVRQFYNVQRSQFNSTNSNSVILLPPKALSEPMEYIYSALYTDAHECKKK